MQDILTREDVFAYLFERGEDEIMAPYESVRIERVLSVENAAVLLNPDRLPEKAKRGR
jgi:hypothetical protein